MVRKKKGVYSVMGKLKSTRDMLVDIDTTFNRMRKEEEMPVEFICRLFSVNRREDIDNIVKFRSIVSDLFNKSDDDNKETMYGEIVEVVDLSEELIKQRYGISIITDDRIFGLDKPSKIFNIMKSIIQEDRGSVNRLDADWFDKSLCKWNAVETEKGEVSSREILGRYLTTDKEGTVVEVQETEGRGIDGEYITIDNIEQFKSVLSKLDFSTDNRKKLRMLFDSKDILGKVIERGFNFVIFNSNGYELRNDKVRIGDYKGKVEKVGESGGVELMMSKNILKDPVSRKGILTYFVN